MEGKVYTPSAFLSLVPTFLNLKGLVSTYICEVHRIIRDNILKSKHIYDKRELFTLSDGGQIYLDFMGRRFVDDRPSDRPIVFILPGLTNDSQQIWGINIVNESQRRGFDVCFINYRGLANCKLATPKWYCAGSFQDFIEPMEYVTKRYGGESKIFAFGVSLGANLLANMLGQPDLPLRIDAAVCFEAPMILTECFEIVLYSLWGFYNRSLGKNLLKTIKKHEGDTEIMKKFKVDQGIDFL